MLQQCYVKLDGRYKRLSMLFSDHYSSIANSGFNRYHKFHAYEGLLSSAWQSWCGFCRHVTYLSLTGTQTAGGLTTASVLDVHSYGRMAYIAKQLNSNGTVKAKRELQPHNEPTWGDQDLLVDLVSGLNPTNAQQLLSGLQLTYNGPKHMRLVRNSIAHLSANGVGEVKRILVHYRGATFLHPLDLLHWEEPASGEPAFLVWLSELLEIGESMVQ